MYFYSLFAYILEKERLNGFESPSLNKIFENYKKLASALIVSLCQFKTRYLFNLASSDILVFNNEYSEVMEHFGPLQGEIAVYVSRRENIQFSILTAFDEGHDEETGYLTDFPIFFTHCLYIAFDIAFKRITENLNNEDLMAHEVLHLENACLIKLFTTPKGSLNVKKLVKLANDGKLDDYIDDYFKLNGIIRVKEESMKKQLGTRFIFSVEENSEIFYYKRRVIDEFYTDYGELDRKNPLKALLNQCQLNLYRL
jgi:hypothetical protein